MTAIIHSIPYIQLVLSVLLIIAILMQRSAAGLGAEMGGDGIGAFNTRRGLEKTLFNATITLAILFAITAIVPIFA